MTIRLSTVLQAFAWNEAEGYKIIRVRLRRYAAPSSLVGNHRTSNWTEEEHELFLDAWEQHPFGPWEVVAQAIPTRDARQVKTHAQKYRDALEKLGESEGEVVSSASAKSASAPSSPVAPRSSAGVKRRPSEGFASDLATAVPRVPDATSATGETLGEGSEQGRCAPSPLASSPRCPLTKEEREQFLFARGRHSSWSWSTMPEYIPKRTLDAVISHVRKYLAVEQRANDNGKLVSNTNGSPPNRSPSSVSPSNGLFPAVLPSAAASTSLLLETDGAILDGYYQHEWQGEISTAQPLTPNQSSVHMDNSAIASLLQIPHEDMILGDNYDTMSCLDDMKLPLSYSLMAVSSAHPSAGFQRVTTETRNDILRAANADIPTMGMDLDSHTPTVSDILSPPSLLNLEPYGDAVSQDLSTLFVPPAHVFDAVVSLELGSYNGVVGANEAVRTRESDVAAENPATVESTANSALPLIVVTASASNDVVPTSDVGMGRYAATS